MTEGTASRRQVVVGVVLGILLLPLPLLLESAYFYGTERTLDVVFHAVVFFGAIQALAILPASIVTSRPSWSLAARSSASNRRTSSPRRGAGTERQVRNAR